MNPFEPIAPIDPSQGPLDADLAAQAVPGHGIPSQDPSSGAQSPLAPEEAEREAKSVLAGGGLVGGAAVGASIGVAVAGPVGVVLGGTLGAVVGTLGGMAAGATMTPEEEANDSASPRQPASDSLPPFLQHHP